MPCVASESDEQPWEQAAEARDRGSGRGVDRPRMLPCVARLGRHGRHARRQARMGKALAMPVQDVPAGVTADQDTRGGGGAFARPVSCKVPIHCENQIGNRIRLGKA